MIQDSVNKNCSVNLDTIQALQLIKDKTGIEITLPTLIAWAKKFRLGQQLGGKNGRWYIDKSKLISHLGTLMKGCVNGKA